MKITNEYGLPDAIVNALMSDYKYKDKQFSVTTILSGIKSFLLMKRHQDEITMDASDGINLVFGTAVHNIFENSKQNEGDLAEEYLKVDVPNTEYKVSGRLDLYNVETGVLRDYKTCSIWKIKFKNFEDWEGQLKLYTWMLYKLGMPVNKAGDIALIKDWSKTDYRMAQLKGEFYPSNPIYEISYDVSKWDLEETEKWVVERFKQIALAEGLTDDEIPECTPEERWNNGNKYAVMKKNRKTAIKVFDNELDAKHYAYACNDNNNCTDFYVEERKGIDRKCVDYCNANKFCNYYKQNVEEN